MQGGPVGLPSESGSSGAWIAGVAALIAAIGGIFVPLCTTGIICSKGAPPPSPPPPGIAAITIMPTSGPPGTVVTVQGENFDAGSVRLKFADTPVAEAEAGINGTFAKAFPIGSNFAPGSFLVEAEQGERRAAAKFTVTEPPGTTEAVIRLEPPCGVGGQSFEVLGEKFKPGSVALLFDGGFVVSAAVGPDGTFSHLLTPREDTSEGAHEVQARFGELSAKATYRIVSPGGACG